MAHYKLGITKKSIITKITSFSSVIVLLSSSLSVILPFILTTPVNAIPPYTSSNPNPATYTSVPFTPSELSTNWSPDRITPSGGYTSGSYYGQSNVLQLGVDSTKANTSSGDYYQYEGIQRQIPASDTIKGSLYVNQDWLNGTVPVGAGLWAVAKNNSNNITAYPIVEFVSAGNGGGSYTGWRAWDGVVGGWTNLTGIGYTANSWNTIEISLNQVTHQFDIYINGQYATANTGDVSTNIGGVIFDNYNYAQNNVNDNYNVDWSNFAYGKYTVLAAPTGLGSYTTSLSSPVQCGGFTNSYNITADWGAVTGAQGYQFNLIKSPNNSLWTSSLLATPSFSSSFIYGQGLYTYEVRALAANNVWSPWSTSCSVTYDTTAPATPTGLSAKFQYDSSTIPSETTLGISSTVDAHGNNLELFWPAPAGWVTGYHILASFPDNTSSLNYQGNNNWSWLYNNNNDGFGQHGNGKYTYTVTAVNPNGSSSPSQSFVLYFSNPKPTVAFTGPTPASNSYVNNNFQVGYTANSYNVNLSSVNVSLFDTNPAHSNHWVTTCYQNNHETSTSDSGICNVVLPANLPDGTYYIQVGAQDQAGNWSVNATRTITIVRTLPTVSITSPNNISDLTGQVTVNGTETTNYPASYNFVVKDSNQKVIAGPGTVNAKSISGWSWDTTKVMNGKYTITLTATDLAGNISDPATLDVTVNNPLAIITMNPLSTTNVNPTINGTVNEQLTSLLVSLNGNTYPAVVSSTKNTDGTYNWSANITNNLVPNNYSVVITAIDQGGNQSVYNSSITIMSPSVTPQLLSTTVKNNVVLPSTSPVTPSSNTTSTNTASQGHVLGAQIVKPSKSSSLNYTNSNSKPAKHNFFYLGWWWLLILAILLSFLYLFLRKKKIKEQS